MTVTDKQRANMKRKSIMASDVQLDVDGEGTFTAKLVTFEQVDHDGDFTVPTAFDHVHGKAIVVCQWGHAWHAPSAGQGKLRVEADGLFIDGTFYLQTRHGRDHYETVKANGPLQEWSYGYDVNRASRRTVDGKTVNVLEVVTPFEASPVMLGAGIGTGTVSIKGESTMTTCSSCGQKVAEAKAADAECAGCGKPMSDCEGTTDDCGTAKDSKAAPADEACADCEQPKADCKCSADGTKSEGDDEAGRKCLDAAVSFAETQARISGVRI